MTLVSLAVVVPWCVVALWLVRLFQKPLSWTVWAPASAGAALGLSSVVWWFLLHVPVERRLPLVGLDLLFWLAAAVMTVWIAKIPPLIRLQAAAAIALPGRRRDTILALMLFVPLLALAVVSFVSATAVLPHGTWDAWAIWNLRARSLFHGWPLDWRRAFATSVSSPHADYPLLLPLSVMRLWMALGHDAVGAPVAVEALFAAATVCLMAGAIARRAGAARGLAAGAVLLAYPTFVAESASQIADIPLAFYMMATFVAIDLADDAPGAGGWAVAAVFASLAAWTKNEGSVFAAALIGALLIERVVKWRRPDFGAIRYAIAGALPIVVALAIFRGFYAPQSELVRAVLGGHVVARVSNTHRLDVILSAMGLEAWHGGAMAIGPLPIFLASVGLAGIQRPVRRAPALALGVVVLMVVAYVVVYATSPFELAWYLRTSVSRVVMQLVPTTIWAVAMLAAPAGRADAPLTT